MSTANLDAVDLSNVAFGGLVNEDVMQQIIDISKIPLPFTDLVGKGTATNNHTEWTQDRLQDQNLDNAVVDGADIDQNDSNTGDRVGNYCQESVKEVKVSTRAIAVDTVGMANAYAYQVMMRSQELRRDVEGMAMLNQGSVVGDGDTIAGRSGGLGAWIVTNSNNGAGATPGGFNTGTGLVDPYVPGTKRGMTETILRGIINQVWTGGGDPKILMSTPGVIEQMSAYFLTEAARVATVTGETSADSGTAELTVKGSVNVFVSDHGQVVEFRPNRLQPAYTSLLGDPADAASLFVLDPEYIEIKYLKNYHVEELAKTGLSTKGMMHVDWCVAPLSEEAQGIVTDIDPTIAMVG